MIIVIIKIIVEIFQQDGDGAIETPAEARCASAGGVFDPLLDILTGSTDFKEIERLCHLANM